MLSFSWGMSGIVRPRMVLRRGVRMSGGREEIQHTESCKE